MGGLSIPHPETVAESFQLNLLQKLYNTGLGKLSVFRHIVTQNLLTVSRPDLNMHVSSLGPTNWSASAKKLADVNVLLAEAFHTAAKLLTELEAKKDTWFSAPLVGHSLSLPMFRIKLTDLPTLTLLGMYTASALFAIDSRGYLLPAASPLIEDPSVSQFLRSKLKHLHSRLLNQGWPKREQKHSPQTWLKIFLDRNSNVSRVYGKWCRDRITDKIKVAPAYNTRVRDRIPVPNEDDFAKAYLSLLNNPLLSSRMKDNSFQVLNRMLWSKQKAFLSNMADDPNCPYCTRAESTEHMLADCDNYAMQRWELLGKAITKGLESVQSEPYGSLRIQFGNIF
jgi:hypothetical protein